MKPSYSIEEKAAAFDLLWENCGNTVPDRCEKRIKPDFDKGIIHHTDVYSFTILCEGPCFNFKDVLHSLVSSGKKRIKNP